ncbi:MAG TPA: alpha/beta fold hydrolase [Bacteroidetes bacterium]|nr:alpha/beta fold hydrolase [Bacteroidota bacterium]
MKLFYREYGEGFPIVILHGLYGSSDNWVSIANELSDTYRLILPDQRNHGKSPHNKLHTYPAMSEDLFELLKSLGIDNFVLVGHSMGGKTASFFASQWPGMLSGLVVIDITPFKTDMDQVISESLHRQILERMTETDTSVLKNREEAGRIFNDISSSVRIRNLLLKNLERNSKGQFEWKLNPRNLYENLDNIFDGMDVPGQGRTEAISGFPVYFLRAMNSDYINESDYEPIRSLFPAAEIIEVADASHWMHTEKPELIVNLVRENFPA